MSIASAITSAQQKVENAYTAISNKGGTLPATQDLSNMPTAISSIPTGSSPVIQSLNVTPSTTAQEITATGGVDGYSPVNVSAVTSSIDANITAGNIKDGVTILGVTGNYGGGGATLFGTDALNWANLQISQETFDQQTQNVLRPNATPTITGLTFTGVSRIAGVGTLKQRFKNNTNVSGTVSFPDLTSFGVGLLSANNEAMYETFYGTSITSLSFGQNRIGILGANNCFSMCEGCTGLTTADLPFRSVVGNYALGNAFKGCTSLVVDKMPLHTTRQNSTLYSTFEGCTSITNFKFTQLFEIAGSHVFQNCFKGCTNLSDLRFYIATGIFDFDDTDPFGDTDTYTNKFENMLSGVTGCTVHFPKCLQTLIGSWSDVTNGFGGTSTTVLFDIISLIDCADSVSYERNEVESGSGYTAWLVSGSTYYYTPSSAEPQIGDTLYSDTACTQAVTTITAVY